MDGGDRITQITPLGLIKKSKILLLIGVILLIALPFLVSDYITYQATYILIFTLFGVSFNLILGYMGELSFGHGVFFGTGAYIIGIFTTKFGVSFLFSLPIAMLISTLVAVIIGLFVVRLTDIYFAMITLAFGEIFVAIVYYFGELTGGSNGITGINATPINIGGFTLNLGSTTSYYIFTLLIVLFSLLVLYKITHSPFGLTIKSIRENDQRAKFIGVPVERCKLLNFTIAGMFAGLAGALYAPLIGTAVPQMLSWHTSTIPVIASLLGGMYSFYGPMIGVIIFDILKETMTNITSSWMLIIGSLIIIIVILLPGGLAEYGKRKIQR